MGKKGLNQKRKELNIFKGDLDIGIFNQTLLNPSFPINTNRQQIQNYYVVSLYDSS